MSHFLLNQTGSVFILKREQVIIVHFILSSFWRLKCESKLSHQPRSKAIEECRLVAFTVCPAYIPPKLNANATDGHCLRFQGFVLIALMLESKKKGLSQETLCEFFWDAIVLLLDCKQSHHLRNYYNSS